MGPRSLVGRFSAFAVLRRKRVTFCLGLDCEGKQRQRGWGGAKKKQKNRKGEEEIEEKEKRKRKTKSEDSSLGGLGRRNECNSDSNSEPMP